MLQGIGHLKEPFVPFKKRPVKSSHEVKNNKRLYKYWKTSFGKSPVLVDMVSNRLKQRILQSHLFTTIRTPFGKDI